jgi:peptide/nickel transport system ATP-binding protein
MTQMDAGAAPAPVLDVRGLRIGFRGRTAPDREVVHGLDLRIDPGECLALVGESGSGKSVTARALVGLVGPDSQVTADRLAVTGQRFEGLRGRTAQRRWRGVRGRRVGFVLQDALGSLDPLVPVGRQIAESLRVAGVPRAEAAQRALAALRSAGMPDPELRLRQRPGQLSGGQRQRALIAAAIVGDPALLIADEPTTALDAGVQARILELLARLKSEGLGLLLVSHDLRAVARVADRIAVMTEGRIVETGPADRILHRAEHPYTRRLLDAVPRGVHPDTVPADSPAVIVAEGLSKTFRLPGGTRLPAVDGVGFTLHRAETLGVVGESGSGKSTLLDLVLGVQPADTGRVRLLDADDWGRMPERRRRSLRTRVQPVAQDPQSTFDPRWTAGRLLAEAGRLARGAGAPAATPAELLDQVGLSPEVLGRRPARLSGGQRQRLAIARALAFAPEVLLCDEPVSALDVTAQAEVLRVLGGLIRERGLSVVFVSHDLAVVREFCDRVLVMQRGVVVERGATAQVLVHPQHPYTRSLAAADRPGTGWPAPRHPGVDSSS